MWQQIHTFQQRFTIVTSCKIEDDNYVCEPKLILSECNDLYKIYIVNVIAHARTHPQTRSRNTIRVSALLALMDSVYISAALHVFYYYL